MNVQLPAVHPNAKVPEVATVAFGGVCTKTATGTAPAPCGPVAPGAPASPFAPGSPACPGAPASPWAPGAPAWPWAPSVPLVPFDPEHATTRMAAISPDDASTALFRMNVLRDAAAAANGLLL